MPLLTFSAKSNTVTKQTCRSTLTDILNVIGKIWIMLCNEVDMHEFKYPRDPITSLSPHADQLLLGGLIVNLTTLQKDMDKYIAKQTPQNLATLLAACQTVPRAFLHASSKSSNRVLNLRISNAYDVLSSPCYLLANKLKDIQDPSRIKKCRAFKDTLEVLNEIAFVSAGVALTYYLRQAMRPRLTA